MMRDDLQCQETTHNYTPHHHHYSLLPPSIQNRNHHSIAISVNGSVQQRSEGGD